MATKETALAKITELVTRFEEQVESYTKSDYNETLTRRDFIDPFFKALGWDIDNEQGFAEAYREVIHEDKIKVGKATKAPDYSFRIGGGKRLFFVEAKKPSVFIKDDITPAYQVRRYGWSAKLPISIITDFQEFAIYDCTKKPLLTDKASTARIKYITYKDYIKEFDFIYDTFSKEKVLKGSFDKFVQSDTYKKGTTTVDKEFLQSLDSWRTYLATSISWNNKDLDEDEINFAVQQTIDRIIFLRIAEDRSVEPYENLKHAIKQGDFYKNLFEQFRHADEKYNSGLFDFVKDKISKHLKIDNKVLKTIISELYYPESPYEFSVLSVEILGSAYEQFLGKVIRITPGHIAKVEEKPEVRKAGGVYYTPQYIVEYIVKNTVGKLIEGKKPKDIEKIKIVDPACGSGSFLIGAYQYLMDWHKDYYTNFGKSGGSSPLQKTSSASPSPLEKVSEGRMRLRGVRGEALTPEGNLTTSEKKRILINNIFGVDIDVNAVEVTKLSLLLKCMEGETEASIATQLRLFNERVLPTLDNNIKDGNSLVDTDYYSNEIDFGEEKKIKPFNWQKAFPEVFKQDGFDCVIGNPPYVKEYTDRESFEHIKKSHLLKYYQGKMDLWYFFMCYGIDILKTKGLLGFIAPNNWVTNAGASILRNKVINDSTILSIADFGAYMVFDGASIQTMVMILEKAKTDNYTFDYCKIETAKPTIDFAVSVLNKEQREGLKYLQPKITIKNFTNKFLLFGDNEGQELLLKIQSKQNLFLDEKKEVAQGIVPNPDVLSKKSLYKISINKRNKFNIQAGEPVFVIPKGYLKKLTAIEKQFLKPIYEPYQMGRYFFPNENQFEIIYLTKKNEQKDKVNNLISHLEKYKEVMMERRETQQGKLAYYHLHWPRDEYFFEKGEKILSVRKCGVPTFVYTEKPAYVMMAFNIIKTKQVNLKYLTALLNSKLIAFWLKHKGKMQGNQYQIDKEPLMQIPIYDTKNDTLKNEITKNVELLLKLNEEKAETKLQTKINQQQSKIDYCENRINEIVYSLYDLTDEEIKIVEGK